jgi:hypothetical protein
MSGNRVQGVSSLGKTKLRVMITPLAVQYYSSVSATLAKVSVSCRTTHMLSLVYRFKRTNTGLQIPRGD